MDAVSGDPKGNPRGETEGVFAVSKGEKMGERLSWREIEVPGMVAELLEGFVDVKTLAEAVAERPRLSAAGDFGAVAKWPRLPAAATGRRELERGFREDMPAEE